MTPPGFRLDPTQLPTAVRVEHVMGAVHQLAGFRRSEIVSKRKPGELARWRRSAMFVARELTGYSLPRLGQVFRRDHTTILWAHRKVTRLREGDPELAAEIQLLAAETLRRAGAMA